MSKIKAEITVEEAAKIMHKHPQFIRWGLQQQRLPFGSAIPKPNGGWSYVIIPAKFYEYMGIKK